MNVWIATPWWNYYVEEKRRDWIYETQRYGERKKILVAKKGSTKWKWNARKNEDDSLDTCYPHKLINAVLTNGTTAQRVLHKSLGAPQLLRVFLYGQNERVKNREAINQFHPNTVRTMNAFALGSDE